MVSSTLVTISSIHYIGTFFMAYNWISNCDPITKRSAGTPVKNPDAFLHHKMFRWNMDIFHLI
jgi:hypothetical protein